MPGFKFVTELNNDEEKKKLQQPKFNFVTELNPQPKNIFKEENIFMDAPNNASSFNARKELNFRPADEGVAPKQGFWDKIRNYDPQTNPVFKAITAPINKLYEIPFTQRIITKAGEAVAGPGVYKNADGSVMRPMDTGSKAGNFAGDFVGAGLGFSVPFAGTGSNINKVTEDALKPVFNKLPAATNKLGEYGLNALRTGLDFGAGNTIQGLAQGQSVEDSLKAGAEGILQGAAFGTALKGLGDIKANINPKWETTFESISPKYAKESASKPLQPLNAQGDINTPNVNNMPLNEAAASTVKPSLGATDRTKSLTQIVSSNDNKVKKGFKETAKDTWEKIYTRFVDINNPIKKLGDETYVKATNSKNVGGTVDYILQDALVDRQGKKIGESLKSIVKDIPENQQDDFMNYVLQRHNIDRAREGKAVYTDFTPEQSAKAVNIIEQLHPEYKALNDRLIKFVRDFETEWGNKSGLISDELWQNLQDTYKNYVPTQRSFDELEKGFTAGNGRGFVDQSNTLKKATGSERDIINPLENIMNLVNKTVRTAKYNEVGQDMLGALRNNPQELKNLAEILPDTEVIGPGIQNVVTVLENGKPVNVRIKNEGLLQSLQAINKGRLDDLDNAAKKATNLFKTLVTQKNPVFAARNIARDIPTAYINGSEMNPIKFVKDLGKAAKDLATNSERAQQYRAIGGGGSNFFKSNDTAKSLKDLNNKSLLKKAGDAIDYVNNLTESAPRLAEFNRVLDKTGDVQKALFAANDVTTNFSRGGDLTKKMDAYVPYLNAGVQGLDKLARQFKNKPIPTAAKGLIGITSFSLVLDQLNKDNPNYQQLDNRTKDNYFIIPDVNNDGKFIKIPKSREYGVMFADLFERTLRASRGDGNSFKGFGNTVATNFSPANPIEDNIAAPLLALKSNKDFANRDIVPRTLQNLSPSLQYDEKTSEIGKKLGQLTNMSPKQIDYLIRAYSGVIGQLGLPAATKSNYNGSAGNKLLKPVTTQFVADRLYSNQAITDFYDNLDKATTKAADKNFTENIASDKVTKEERLKNDLAKTSKALSDYNKKIREAEQKNDMDMVRELRLKMIETAQKANKIYSSK